MVLGRARRTEDIQRVRVLVEVAGRSTDSWVARGSIAVFFLGSLTMWAQGLPLWTDGTRWATVSLIAFPSLIPLVPPVFIPRGRAFEIALVDAIGSRRVTPELAAAFHDPVTAEARWYELLLVASVIFLMIVKTF